MKVDSASAWNLGCGHRFTALSGVLTCRCGGLGPAGLRTLMNWHLRVPCRTGFGPSGTGTMQHHAFRHATSARCHVQTLGCGVHSVESLNQQLGALQAPAAKASRAAYAASPQLA
eukprot:354711-Chlamydomonas_euryale.AAC.4